MREFDFLKSLCFTYGSHFIHKYFGFSLKNIAEKMGITQTNFSKILKQGLPRKHRERFSDIFKELQIEERSKNFKPDFWQKWDQEHRKKDIS